MGDSQVDELLVISVLASDRGFGCNRFELGQCVELRQHGGCLLLVAPQTFDDLWISQHPLQLVAHWPGGEPAQCPRLQTIAQRLGSRVPKDENVENDIGVDDDFICGHALFP